VLNSRWSAIGGTFPVSGLAIGAYLALLVAGFFTGPHSDAALRRLAWSVMLVLSGAIAGSAIWFIIVQQWFIGSFCRYCITTHITGLLLSALICWRAFIAFRHDPPTLNFQRFKTMGLAGAGLILAGGMAVSQISFTLPANSGTGDAAINLFPIDYRTAPMIGDRNALYKVIMLFDYNCPHCQKIHAMLKHVVKQYGNKLAFVLCPTPLNTQCNPYIPQDIAAFKNSCDLAKIGLAVWKASHDAFDVFDSWMFRDEPGSAWQPRGLPAARAKAVELIGQSDFDKAASDPWMHEYLQQCVQRYEQTTRNGKGGVPKLVFGTRWVIPEPNDVNDLIMILQKTLALPEP
jgi:protein-disulfide isomerase